MRRRGFVLIELFATFAVALCIVVAILLMGNAQRRQGRLGEDIAKLRSLGSLTVQYAADNEDKFWTFSWKKGQNSSQYPDLNNPPDDLRAAAYQATDILRRRAGRTDFIPPSSWNPYSLYSHLALVDYGARVPDEFMVSAADKRRLLWARDPRGFDGGVYQPAPSSPAPGSNDAKRWPYSSSFQLETAFYDKGIPPNRVSQGSVHNQTLTPGIPNFGGKLMSDTVFPAHKVHLHDQMARHFGTKQPYCTHDQARLPNLYVDGSVAVNAAAESNPGWQPNSPASAATSSFLYQPDIWEPATYSGGVSEFVTARFRWTRGFLDGRDFGGPEVCTGQPGCP